MRPEDVLKTELAKVTAREDMARAERALQRQQDAMEDPYYLLGVRIAEALERLAAASPPAAG